jgi:hypothetical protein
MRVFQQTFLLFIFYQPVQYLAMLLLRTSEFEVAIPPIYLYLFPDAQDYETHFI